MPIPPLVPHVGWRIVGFVLSGSCALLHCIWYGTLQELGQSIRDRFDGTLFHFDLAIDHREDVDRLPPVVRVVLREIRSGVPPSTLLPRQCGERMLGRR